MSKKIYCGAPVQACDHILHTLDRAWKLRFPDVKMPDVTRGRLNTFLVEVVKMANVGGVVAASQNFIAKRCNDQTARTVRKNIRDLEALGLIETIPNYDKQNMRLRNTYKLDASLFWKKGKEFVKEAVAAAKKAVEGASSLMVRRAKRIHEAMRKKACDNLKRGNAPSPNQQAVTALTDEHVQDVLTLVRQLGFKGAAMCLSKKGLTEAGARQIWEKFGGGHVPN
jgi:hypothetical protein